MKTPITMLMAAAAMSIALAAPAAAQTRDRFASRIAYADLNLTGTAGADAMLGRIRSAAAEACGDRMGRMTLSEHRRIRACSNAFAQKAVIRLENPVVAQRYLERGGRLPAVTVASL